MAENVKVCVRVRPFNSREIKRNAKLIIHMNGKKTSIANPSKPEEDPREFTFDQSYWSHDGFEETKDGLLEAKTDKYASQQKVFDDLGTGVLQNAFDGYNTSLFAYGQTGSGKSYSMVGYGSNKGIVPIAFQSMFDRIEANKDDNTKYQVTFSMIEIYMEQVADLLVENSKKLKVRQNPQEGRFFVDGLTKTPVSSYNEIQARMEAAMKKRTVAATQMNATSSRAHTVVTVAFTSIITNPDSGKKTTRSSEINLIDLAGSERANSTGATGARLKEGAQINLSLSALGNVIAALAAGKKAPFRDSVLTKLLKNSLGGNAKTIMIAALSPTDINFDETLSTLRYADRAKQIKNKAVVNESATDKLIRSLKEENERMKKMLEGKMPSATTKGMSEAEVQKMRKEMEANIRAQIVANEERSKQMDEDAYAKEVAKLKTEYEAKAKAQQDKAAKDTSSFRLVNVNEDPALSGMVIYQIEEGETLLGRKAKANKHNPKIQLAGLSIYDKHCLLTMLKGKVTLSIPGNKPAEQSKTAINGSPIAGRVALNHNDRILFGTNHLYIFKIPNPTDEDLKRVPEEIDWEFAQKEIMENKGFNLETEESLHLSTQTREEVMNLLPTVAVANAISERLDKQCAFEVAVLSGPVAGLQKKESKVMVKIRNLVTGNKWMIDPAEFTQRQFVMQRLLQKNEDEDSESADDEDEEDEDESEDPFLMKDEHVILGTGTCFLQSLCYHIEFDDTLNIVDYKGRSEGKLAVSVYPCNADGTLSDLSEVNEDPKALLGKPLSFKISISTAQIKKSKYSQGALVKFEHEYLGGQSKTDIQLTTNPTWNFEKVFTIDKVCEASLEWLQTGTIGFFVYVWQSDSADPVKNQGMSTFEMIAARRASGVAREIDAPSVTAFNEQLLINQELQKENRKLKASNWKSNSGEVQQLRTSLTSCKKKLDEVEMALVKKSSILDQISVHIEDETCSDSDLRTHIKALLSSVNRSTMGEKSNQTKSSACSVM